MITWQERIKEFRAEKSEYHGAAATLVLMFLAIIGECYAYKMAEKFKEGLTKGNGWDDEQIKYLRSLSDHNQLNVLLPKMEEKGFIISREEPIKSKKDPTENTKRYRRYYRLDPWICVAGPSGKLYPSEGEGCLLHGKKVEEEFYLAADFLVDLIKNDYMHYFKLFSSIRVFDFITFLMLLKDEAMKLNNKKMEIILINRIGDAERVETESREFFERLRIAESEKEKRQIKWDDNPG